MPQLKELNENVSLAEQMKSTEAGPIVLMNVFTIEPADEEALIAAWKHDADFMKQQPGYVSTQMHKAIGGSPTFINYAIWESVGSFRAAFANPEFQSRIAQYPDSAVATPHLFKKLAVSGHCVA